MSLYNIKEEYRGQKGENLNVNHNNAAQQQEKEILYISTSWFTKYKPNHKKKEEKVSEEAD